MWSLEVPHHLLEAVFTYRAFQKRHPNIRIIIAANTEREHVRLERRGVEAILANHNMFVDENVFKPMPHVMPMYDAIYNANFSAFKRRELSAEIAACAHIGYVSDPDRKENSAELLAEAKAQLPHHDFLNPVSPTGARRISSREVNSALAKAKVGLCLSEAEGAMTSSMEYMLAGLPVVSTPSLGGRSRYFHPRTSIIAEPNPRAIREAVEAMKARNIPRNAVRAITLRMVQKDRDAFNAFMDQLREGRPAIAGDPRWRFSYVNNLYHWRTVDEFAAQLGLNEMSAPPTAR
jgi:glycosyltransferase involved in cell wall biosynthesis